MCTVSYIPKGDSFVFTSNRDEHKSRPPAYVPQQKIVNGQKIIYPEDPKAGGTWFAVNERGILAVLLNGAFKKHTPKGNYAKSRGLVVLDIISNKNPQDYLTTIDLFNIEPFTILVFQEGNLKELRWNGEEKFIKKVDATKTHIWSSVTLYKPDVIEKRQAMFSSFIEKESLETSNIIDFHCNNNEDFENGFVINRDTGLKTFSVTQAVLQKTKVALEHIDMLQEEKYVIEMPIKELINQI